MLKSSSNTQAILWLIEQGYDEGEVAKELNISLFTVKKKLWRSRRKHRCISTKELLEKYFTTNERS